MVINWLTSFADRWQTQVRQERAPHAVLLLGAPGVGKRAAAAWLAQTKLQPAKASELPGYPAEVPVHPDLYWLTRPEDKHTIGIDQIRSLIGELSLTSHNGLGKVAIVEPANIMTAAAANSLLKTLEEPPGDALIILIADRLSRLPATILSRCQKITIGLPDEAVSIAWLDRVRPGMQWSQALREAGGAPLAALTAADQMEDTAALGRDLKALANRAVSPIDVAERWSKQSPTLALDWLGR
ncbi:MAG: DNA polymerase III subunit delta', partial [Woeseia sp.]